MSQAKLAVSLDVSAVPEHPVGAGRYTIELAHALDATGELDLHLVTRRSDAARWQTLCPSAAVHPVVPGPRPLRIAFEQLWLPRLLARWGVDVHHGPHYTLPERTRIPLVATIHDLTFFTRPGDHEAFKVRFFQRAIRRAVDRAALLISVSDATRRALLDRFPDAPPVVVAPHGVDGTRFHPEAAPDDAAAVGSAGVEGHLPVLLHVGTVEPRKGLDLLAQAAIDLIASGRQLQLVVAGRRGWGGDLLAPYRDALGSNLVETGYVTDEQVPALLRRAAVVAYPSREEGFGLPVLEAMACGASVVTTEGSVMAEVAAGAARLARADDVESLATAIAAALDEDEAQRVARRSTGLAVAAEATWSRSASLHLEAYRRAAGLLG